MAPSGTCSKAGTPWTEQYNKVRRIHTEYRALPHGGEKISVIGMGSFVIGGGDRQIRPVAVLAMAGDDFLFLPFECLPVRGIRR